MVVVGRWKMIGVFCVCLVLWFCFMFWGYLVVVFFFSICGFVYLWGLLLMELGMYIFFFVCCWLFVVLLLLSVVVVGVVYVGIVIVWYGNDNGFGLQLFVVVNDLFFYLDLVGVISNVDIDVWIVRDDFMFFVGGFDVVINSSWIGSLMGVLFEIVSGGWGMVGVVGLYFNGLLVGNVINGFNFIDLVVVCNVFDFGLMLGLLIGVD